VNEIFSIEPFWTGPVLRARGVASERTIFLTDEPEAEMGDCPSDEWAHYWGSSLRSEPIYQPAENLIEVVVTLAGRLVVCSPAEAWASLSLLSGSDRRSQVNVAELVAKNWELPALTYRPHDESGITVEAQIARLERCAGTDAANSVRSELEHQIAGAEDEPVTVPVAALRRLVDFMCAHPRVKPPYVFISGEKLKAQWQPSADQIAWIEFDATEHVRVLAFYPDPKAFGGVKRFMGHSTVQDAYLDLRRLGVDWMAR
jgi:hypothetical protein